LVLMSSSPLALVSIPFLPLSLERERRIERPNRRQRRKKDPGFFFYFGLGNTLPSREKAKRSSPPLLSPSFFELRFISPLGVETVGACRRSQTALTPTQTPEPVPAH
jgi:hypothetical protein